MRASIQRKELKMSSKDPAFLFYSSDFLTGTMFMTDEQVGKFTRLLCAQHQKGFLTEKDMLIICKSYDEDIFSKFKKTGDQFFNERLVQEMQKRAKYSLSRSLNRKTKTYEKDMNNICKTYDEHMENENENRIEIENRKENKGVQGEKFEEVDDLILWPSFEDFWHTYQKKVDRTGAEKVWKKIKQDQRELLMAHVPLYVMATPNKQYRKDPDTYLRNESWKNEIIETQKQNGKQSTTIDIQSIYDKVHAAHSGQ